MDKKLEICSICKKKIENVLPIYISKNGCESFCFYHYSCLVENVNDNYFMTLNVIKSNEKWKNYSDTNYLLSYESKHYKLRKRKNMLVGIRVKHMQQLYLVELLRENINKQSFLKKLKKHDRVWPKFAKNFLDFYNEKGYMSNKQFKLLKEILELGKVTFRRKLLNINNTVINDKDLSVFNKIMLKDREHDFIKWFNKEHALTNEDKLTDYESEEEAKSEPENLF